MLTENFSSIELGDAAAYAPYFRALPLHAADYTFTNLWGWGTHYNLEWRTAHGLCWIRQKRNDLPVERLWAPVGDWYAADWAAMPELVPGTTILRAPEPLCELLLERLPGRVAIEETPGQWEYLVYAGSALDPRGQQAPQEKEPRQRVHEGLWGGLPRPERRNHAAGAGAPR